MRTIAALDRRAPAGPSITATRSRASAQDPLRRCGRRGGQAADRSDRRPRRTAAPQRRHSENPHHHSTSISRLTLTAASLQHQLDLGNMMLVLAVRTGPARVYRRALSYFTEPVRADGLSPVKRQQGQDRPLLDAPDRHRHAPSTASNSPKNLTCRAVLSANHIPRGGHGGFTRRIDYGRAPVGQKGGRPYPCSRGPSISGCRAP
jgi:hypothetical protein